MRRGFTLLELMIVISIIVVVGGFVWIGLSNIGSSQELKNVTLVAANILRDAQQRSTVQQDGYYWGVQFENVDGRDKFTLFRTTTRSADNIEEVVLTTMRSTVELVKPVKNNSPLKVIFNQITGQLISTSCPSSDFFEEVEISVVNKEEDKSQIKIFCNGRVEFQK